MKNIFFTFFTLINTFLISQDFTNNFSNPVKIPIILSGNFGEIRNNHFHSGIDIKTKGSSGIKIFAIQDGYISRIKVSPSGYGKAIYLNHSNGLTSVYGHLSKFTSKLDSFVNSYQYFNKTYSIDIFFNADDYVVKNGDLIGFSGNSGSSSAPHLHFEIMDTKSQKVLNPAIFGFNSKDTSPPVIKSIFIYPLNNNSKINFNNDTVKFDVIKISKNKYSLNSSEIFVSGKLGFGVETYDLLDFAPNLNGVYSIELFINSLSVYKHVMDEFEFNQTKYVNSFIDFNLKKKYSINSHKSFIDKNNRLDIYKKLINNGIGDFNSNSIYNIKYVIKDFNGNESSLNFDLISIQSQDTIQNYNYNFKCEVENIYKKSNLILKFKKNTFYNDINFKIDIISSSDESLSDFFKIHDENTPVHIPYQIKIELDSLNNKLKNKVVICSELNSSIDCYHSYWDNNFIISEVDVLGTFYATIDTVKPVIKEKLFKYDLSSNPLISFNISDHLSGIKKYDAYIDDKWVLFEYDKKNDLIKHFFDNKIQKGQHQLKIIVYDKVDNKSQVILDFIK